jgi:hypothetical protein
MQTRLAVLVLLLAGCDDDSGVPKTDAAVDLATTDAAQCVKTCGTCGADQACVGTSTIARYQAACMKTCRVTSDCAQSERCVAIFNEVGVAPVCVSDTAPARCPGVAAPAPNDHCDFARATCVDANTLSEPFALNVNHVCGYQRVACANGCVEGSADAGVLAHCN